MGNVFSAISYSLSNLLSVLEHLELSWARAFLRRTRFMDPDFQGDVLAVICTFNFVIFFKCLTESFPTILVVVAVSFWWKPQL